MERISRRTFLQTAAVAGTTGALAPALVASAKKPLSICLVSGSLEYKSDESLAEFQYTLEADGFAKCSRAFRKSDHECPGLEALKSADLMILFTRRLKITGESLQLVKDYCASGKPIVGIRTASHAFQNWLALDKEVLGGSYKGHCKGGIEVAVTIAKGAERHPILEGVEPFASEGKLYKNPANAKDTKTLLVGTIPGFEEPIAWTRMHGAARVFYTSLGHPKDFTEPSFRRLLLNGIRWTTAN